MSIPQKLLRGTALAYKKPAWEEFADTNWLVSNGSMAVRMVIQYDSKLLVQRFYMRLTPLATLPGRDMAENSRLYTVL